jgi:hypothetical protein
MVMVRPAAALVHWPAAGSWHRPGRSWPGRDGGGGDWGCRRSGGALGGAGDGAGGKIDLALILGEVSFGCDRGLDLDQRVDPISVEAGQQRPGAIGTVTVDGRPRRWRAIVRIGGCRRRVAVDLVDQLGQQLGRGGGVAEVAGGGGGRRDQLAVRVD